MKQISQSVVAAVTQQGKRLPVQINQIDNNSGWGEIISDDHINPKILRGLFMVAGKGMTLPPESGSDSR